MSHFRETPLYSGLELVTVTNMVVRPQDLFPFHNMPGVDRDGETVKVFDLKEELGGQYFVIFFFPMDLMDLTVDSEEVRSLQAMVETFAVEGCQVVGVMADSPLAISRWINKNFGGALGFPLLSDHDLVLSMSLGVAREAGVPARATFIVDWSGAVRFMATHRTDIPRSLPETLRLVQAFRSSDLTGEARPSDWVPGAEAIPTDFTKKVAFYQQKYGQGGKQEELPTSVPGKHELPTCFSGKKEELPNSASGKQEELPDSASYTATYISGKQEEFPISASGKQEELNTSISGKQEELPNSVSGKQDELNNSVSGKQKELNNSVSGKQKELTTSVSGKQGGLPSSIYGKQEEHPVSGNQGKLEELPTWQAYFQRRYGQGGNQEVPPTPGSGQLEELPYPGKSRSTSLASYNKVEVEQQAAPTSSWQGGQARVIGKKKLASKVDKYDTDKKKMGDTVVPQMSSGGLFEHLVRNVGGARDCTYFRASNNMLHNSK